jgi:hypothetical protein
VRRTDGHAGPARRLTQRMESPAVQLEREEEAALVTSWRFEVLFRAGYSRQQAFELARSEADSHLAVALLRQGCPVELALRILL